MSESLSVVVNRIAYRSFALLMTGTFNQRLCILSVILFVLLTFYDHLRQRWANYGPRATCGQPSAFLRPAKNCYEAKITSFMTLSFRL